MLTPEVREALEATLVVARQQFDAAEQRYDKYSKLADDANEEANAASQLVTALKATLAETASPNGDYLTFGDE